MNQRYVLNTKAFVDILKERKITIRYMAKWFNVSPSYISMLLNNKKPINIDWFFSIVSFLRIKLVELNDYVSLEEEIK